MRDSEMKPEEWQWKWEIMVCDPLFWQALGKERGWDADLCPTCGGGYRISARMVDWCENYCENDGFPTAPRPGWQYHWHRFIDHLAEGKSIEDFFANLLPHDEPN